MSTSDFEKLPPKHNWSPDVKKGTASIFIDKDDLSAWKLNFQES
jgi:hypothetical protein